MTAPASRGLVGGLLRVTAAALSAGAALVSILSYTGMQAEAARGSEGPSSSPERAHRLSLTPTADTATSIGDSLPLAAVVTDDRGAALLGVAPAWSSADPAIAEVDQAGTVVSRGPGMTAVIVRVGRLEARARVVVAQRPAGIRLGDTLLRVPEGERFRAVAQVLDARGHPIAGAPVRWSAGDAAVAAIDSLGEVEGTSPGRSVITASAGDLRADLPVEVVPIPASITVLEGEDQRAPAGRALATLVTAQIVSRTGRPIPGVAATFLPRAAAALATPATDTADERGLVRAVWTLDPTPGRQQLAIAVEGVAVTPVVTAEADPVPANTRVSLALEPGSGTAGDSLPEPVVIRVTDTAGLALADLPVAWTTADGGRLTALGPRTESLGEARAVWHLGPRAGRQRARAQVGNARSLPALTVTAVALAGAADSLAVRAGDRQTATAGTALKQRVVVRAVDRRGNPVPGARLSWGDSTAVTDSSGQARLAWTLATTAGVQRRTVALEGSKARVEVTARAVAGAPAKVAFVSAPASAPAGRALTDPLTLEVTDASGNPVAGRRVLLSSTSGTLAPARAVTDSAGRARTRWTPGAKAGSATLTAKVEKTRVQATRTVALTARRSARTASR
ncbi:MAG TPA: Ig-like domain-containing protein [Gemmatimonadales bacterium]|nr:Ig-like domain-containing protein [Gemmatimonadales bacterium]